MRYGARDFGYSFVSADDEGDAAGADVPANKDLLRQSSRAGDETSKPYVYSPPSPKYGLPSSSASASRGGATKTTAVVGGDFDSDGDHHYDDGGGAALALSGFGACCCCACAALVVSGGVLLAYERFSEGAGNNDLLLAGSIVLAAAAGAFLLGCCGCFFSCAAACAPPPGGGEGGGGGSAGLLFGGDAFGGHGDEDDHHNVKLQLRRLNDRYERAERALNSIHLNVIADMKEVREAQKNEEKARKDEEKRKREELEDRVKRDLEAGLTTNAMRRNYRPVAFFVRFHGDTTLSSSMELLRRQVSLIVNCGRAGVDSAVVVVTSPGGVVSPYGLAASQLVRIRKAGIKLVV